MSGLDFRPHVWTLPLAPDRWAYLQLPSRHVSEAEWEQLLAVLEVFKPGLIGEDEVPTGAANSHE